MIQALRIGIAGLGTVGSAVLRLFDEKAKTLALRCGRPLKIVAVSAKNLKRKRGIAINSYKWYDDPLKLASSEEIDVFVELMGGEQGIAYLSVERALKTGHHVVTANKALLAHQGIALAKLAESKGLLLNFEAAVAGGIPIIKLLRESFSSNRISRVYSILNGTCNYILTRMRDQGLSFEQCLKEAQNLGYAEADPTLDIEGNDTAHKLALLTSLAFGTVIMLDDIYIKGIRNISLEDIRAADELGYRIKLLGVTIKSDTGIEQRVQPTMVPTSSMIAQVNGVTNAIAIESDLIGKLFLSGAGAGGNPTASAILSDITDIAIFSQITAQNIPVFGRPTNILKPYKKSAISPNSTGYFIRCSVDDCTDLFSFIAQELAKNHISLKTIIQKSLSDNKSKPKQTILLITHQTSEFAIYKAFNTLMQNGTIVNKPQIIRIESPV
ncbi:MAG: homoserine dehydrogenase [Candidatus Tokpelaia sp. JSC161]|jgi:homoserine dehydrogenase|nr:MAG: homoserine dehydrogenase [Candidatus Tokpelaia sp. JSC161]